MGNRMNQEPTWQMLTEFDMPHERDGAGATQTLDHVTQVVRPLQLPQARLERMECALNEAVQNAVERVDATRCRSRVSVRVLLSNLKPAVIGDGVKPPADGAHGWGFFLIEKTAGGCPSGDDVHYMIELYLYHEGD